MSMTGKIIHKNDEVVEISLDDRGFIEKVGKVLNKDLLPCIYSEDKSALRIGLQRWILTRSLGRTRSDISPLKAFYGSEVFNSLNKVSLFDCYWIKNDKDDKDIKWEDISPYTNWDYESDCYFDLLFDPENTYEVDNKSPNLTIPGNDHQFWYRHMGNLGIINESSQSDMKIYKKAKELGIDKVMYPRQYIVLKGTIYSFKMVDTSEEVERFPFDIIYEQEADKNKNKMENLKDICERHNLENWREYFASIIKLDEECIGKERDLCEFGVLRDTNTLKILGFERI